jgi:hypothetical protein
MFGWFGYLIWLLLGIRLAVYLVWLWKQNFRLGAVGAVFIGLGALAALIAGTLFGSGME